MGLAQSFAWTKELRFVPVRVMLLMVSGEVPVLVSFTACAGEVVPTAVEAKVRLAGLTDTVGTAIPGPLRVTDCGEPVALSVMVTAAVNDPTAVGLKATMKEQLPPGAIVAPQVFS